MRQIKLFLLKYAAYFLRLTTFKYNAKNYSDFFISNYPKSEIENPLQAKKIVYCFWTGDNQIPENRQRSLNKLKNSLGVELCLVKKNDLDKYILKEHPLHPAYDFLSLNHRSDYLRCYFMHFWGGGYVDIKENLHSWENVFDKLNGTNKKWLAGYPEIAPSVVPILKGKIGKDIKKNYFKLIGNGCFIVKPQTPFTNEWYIQVNKLLDDNYEALKNNPMNERGSKVGYPLKWAEVQAEIFHPLVLKYCDKVMYDKSLLLSFKNYK